MLTFEQIKELIELVATHRLSGLELERSGLRLKIEGESSAPVVVSPPMETTAVAVPPVPAGAAPVPAAPDPEPAAEEVEDEDLHQVVSPLVGTHYRRPDPDAPPYVKVGDAVSEGQTLCIVEAMKIMNEIESDVEGEIVKIYVEDGQAVEYGEPLYGIRTA